MLPFRWLLCQCVGEGVTPYAGLLHFTLYMYLIMLSVKQGSIKYHFLRLWYDSSWDRTQVSRAVGEHTNHYANVQLDAVINGDYIENFEIKINFPDFEISFIWSQTCFIGLYIYIHNMYIFYTYNILSSKDRLFRCITNLHSSICSKPWSKPV